MNTDEYPCNTKKSRVYSVFRFVRYGGFIEFRVGSMGEIRIFHWCEKKY